MQASEARQITNRVVLATPASRHLLESIYAQIKNAAQDGENVVTVKVIAENMRRAAFDKLREDGYAVECEPSNDSESDSATVSW